MSISTLLRKYLNSRILFFSLSLSLFFFLFIVIKCRFPEIGISVEHPC